MKRMRQAGMTSTARDTWSVRRAGRHRGTDQCPAPAAMSGARQARPCGAKHEARRWRLTRPLAPTLHRGQSKGGDGDAPAVEQEDEAAGESAEAESPPATTAAAFEVENEEDDEADQGGARK